MMKSKISVALIFGGRSPEHEVSINSARNIYRALDPERYDLQLIGLSKEGRWYRIDAQDFLDPGMTEVLGGEALALVPGAGKQSLIRLSDGAALPPIDVAFPITHGSYGEDGSLQGVFRHLDLPFVGPDVLASAAAMDKDVAKRLLREADLLIADFVCYHHWEQQAVDFAAVANKLGLPLFVKPANMGSSVGVRRVEDKAGFDAAIADAFHYDHKVIVEMAIEGREIECAVLGNGTIATTSVGELKMRGEGFYTYDAKYLSDSEAQVVIPAPDLDNATLAKLMLVAKNAYLTLGCEGMSRVDLFLCEDGSVYVNEVNTLPGFTNISMYPKLWEHAGMSYSELLDELIALALERGARQQALVKSL